MIFYILVFMPIVAALVGYPICRKSDRFGDAVILAVSVAELVAAVVLMCMPNSQATISGFCGVGISFAAGNLRSVMALTSALLWLMTTLVSPEYFRAAKQKPRYYTFYLWTLGATMGIFLAGDMMTMFIFFEMMSFTSYVWVAQEETPQAIRASETYLYISVIGGLVMLTGLFMLYAGCGTFSTGGIAKNISSLTANGRLAIGLCLLVGFGVKAGMFPLHVWLPESYTAAPAPASALLSGILSKIGVFGIIVFSCCMFDGNQTWGNILLVPAAITMFLGALLALFSTNLKRTLACSSMSQIGFILVGVSMYVLLGNKGAPAADGAVLHMLNHSLIKLTLFVAAGVICLNMHSLDLNELRGSGKGKPLLMLAFLSGACSVAGIPGFGGYVSKTLLHESIVEYIHLLASSGIAAGPYRALEVLFLFSGGLTFAYMARLFYILFLTPPTTSKAPGQPKLSKSSSAHEKGTSYMGKPTTSYMGKPTSAVLAVCGILMPFLGLAPHISMDKIADYSRMFFTCQSPMETLHYFSFTNLKGALISISIGAVIFFIAERFWLTERSGDGYVYKNLWPKKLNLEYGLYRPALKALSVIGAAAARCVESLAAALIYGTVNLIMRNSKQTIKPPEDREFAAYLTASRQSMIQRSFESDLLAVALGILIFLAIIFTKVV